MTKQTTLKQLHKCAKSLSNQVYRNGKYNGMGNARTANLVYKFEELRENASNEVWEQFCNETGASLEHDAWDRLA